MHSVFLPNSARLLDYAVTGKSSARKAAKTVITIKLEFDDPVDAGFLLRDLAEADRLQRSPYRPSEKSPVERSFARAVNAIGADVRPLMLTHRREG
jgi:hypothetical protein